jgi:L-ascorbate metabolism protein UlaG (beta-lactamase superfamily)
VSIIDVQKVLLRGSLAEHLADENGTAGRGTAPGRGSGTGAGAVGEAALGGASLLWLGQAGFVLRSGADRDGRRGTTAVIDPYLSDYLAEKYAGREFPHTRMMRVPIAPENLTGVDAVFCTHSHSDHMDPKTLPALAAANPRCTFVVPAAVREEAERRGAPADRILPLDAGDTAGLPGHSLQTGPANGEERSDNPAEEAGAPGENRGISVRAVPGAHETLETDDAGRHRFLGYIIEMGGIRFYHSGDGIPYEGLEERIGPGNVDVALLPVNGRDAYRRERGVPGNFTVEEALELCAALDIPVLIPHHFGMFDFNTVDPKDIARIYGRKPRATRIETPETAYEYRFRKT